MAHNVMAPAVKRGQVSLLDYRRAGCELKKSDHGNFMFKLKAGNGQAILTSEPCSSKQAAQNGIASVRKNAVTARVIDPTCHRK